MIVEFWAPTRGREKPVLQHRDAHGDRGLALQTGMPVLYEDLAGAAPGCEPARVSGLVVRLELRLVSPEPKLLVWLQSKPPDELQLIEQAERKSTP